MTDLVHLHEALVVEVRRLYWAEKQLHAFAAKLLALPARPAPEVVGRAGRSAPNRRWRLEQAFRCVDEDISSRRCPRMSAILEQRVPPSDVVLHASGYLSGLYATAAARARALDYVEVACLLDECGADVQAVTTGGIARGAGPTGDGPAKTLRRPAAGASI